MNGRSIYLLPFIYESGTSTPGYSQKQFNTHDHFGNFISFSENSHILANAESLAHGLIGYPTGNTASLYLVKIVWGFLDFFCTSVLGKYSFKSELILLHFEYVFLLKCTYIPLVYDQFDHVWFDP